MNKNTHIILIYCLLAFSIKGYSQKQSNDSLKMDIILNNVMLKEAKINTKFINAIDYTPNGFLLLFSSNQFYMLGMGSMLPLFNKTKITIDAYTTTQGRALWVVSDDKLCSIDSTGNLYTLYKLPISNAGIVSGNDANTAYIYDRTYQKDKKEYAIYQASEKKYTRLASTSAPILSAHEYKTSLLFSSENKIICADSKTKTFFDLFILSQKQNIISITGDTVHQVIYFSTPDTIYRVKEGKLEYVNTEFGGTLKYDGEGLLIFKPEKSLIVRFRNNILYPVADKKSELLPLLKLNIDREPENMKTTMLLNKPRDFILKDQIPQAIQAYAQLANKDDVEPVVLLEYAYALALGGIYDGALMNLDRAKLSGASLGKNYFYAGQIFALMGFNRPAIEFLTNSSVPRWIYSIYDDLYKEYQSSAFTSQDKDLETAFSRANYLVANSMNFQAIALFEQIIENSPEEYLFHAGYSIPLEKIGLRELAAKEMATGISLLPADKQNSNVELAFNERLSQLNQRKDTKQIKQPEARGMKSQGMIYVGGSASSAYTSINGRFGLFFTNSFNASFDLGVSNDIINNFTTTSVGLSAYQHLGKVFVIGVGFSDQITDTENMSINPSIGLSFMNKKRTSSWDIFFNVYCPIADNANYLYGFSIGKSFYFGKRK